MVSEASCLWLPWLLLQGILQTAMATLDYSTQRRYTEKLKVGREDLPDPYEIPESMWQDYITKWPSIQFGDLYTYLIESKGPYTKESLKAYKSLQVYNYFYNGYVRTVYFYGLPTSKLALLKAQVNPSQKSADQNHEAWVVILKETGEVKAAHCKCMAG